MIANCAFLAGITLLLVMFVTLDELQCLVPYKQLIVRQYLWTVVAGLLVSFAPGIPRFTLNPEIIFLVVLLSCLWTVALLFPGIPILLPIIPTVATLVASAAIFVVRKLQAKAAAAAIEKTLKSQGDAFAAQARPDQQPEIQALQSEFSKAVSALKSSKLARGGSDALGVLPWYLIIGPPGAGKSTALSKSGLQFPYLSAGGRG